MKDVRLRALQEDPDAFGSTYDRESLEDESSWHRWITGWPDTEDQALFAAVQDGAWFGMALGVRWRERPEEANVYAMWVDPARRRSGAGRSLLDAVVGWARDSGAAGAVLRVAEANEPARTLYERAGFVDTRDREPLREGSSQTTIVMRRGL